MEFWQKRIFDGGDEFVRILSNIDDYFPSTCRDLCFAVLSFLLENVKIFLQRSAFKSLHIRLPKITEVPQDKKWSLFNTFKITEPIFFKSEFLTFAGYHWTVTYFQWKLCYMQK